MDVGLFEAWSHWLDGDSLDQAYLWGISIRWWGRIGRILEFLAALTIVAEIIGAERLRDFARSLRTRVTARRAWSLAWESILWAWIWIYDFMVRDEDLDEVTQRTGTYRTTAKLHLVVTALLFPPTIYFLWRWGGWGGAVWSLLIAPSAAIAGTVLVVLAYALPALALEWVVVRPVASILDRDALDKWIKSGAALMLLAGFHFDLLSS